MLPFSFDEPLDGDTDDEVAAGMLPGPDADGPSFSDPTSLEADADGRISPELDQDGEAVTTPTPLEAEADGKIITN